MENDGRKDRYPLLFALAGALLNVPFLGGAHLFDWDEINFAEISREMVVLGDYLRMHVDFVPFTEKPPLFFWLQAAAMHAFGVGEFAARLPNALCGAVTLPLLYLIGRRLYDRRFGLLWAGGYVGSILPTLYFSSGIIDPVFNLFIFLALYYFVLFHWKKSSPETSERLALQRGRWFYLLCGGAFLGLAMMTKGQAAFVIVCIVLFVYWVKERFRFYVSVPEFLAYAAAAIGVSLLWYGVETAVNGPGFVQDFLIRQYMLFSQGDAGHSGFPGYHAVVLLIGCFPASVFCLRAFRKLNHGHSHEADFRFWMAALFWGVLVLFSIVRSKIVHYSSMAYFPVTYLSALVVYKTIKGEIPFSGWMKGGLWAILGLFSFVFAAVPFLGMDTGALVPYIEDPFAVANLAADPGWTGLEALTAVYFLAVAGYGIREFSGGRAARGAVALFAGTAVLVKLVLAVYVPKIEAYSQRANVEFFEAHADEDAYYKAVFYRSYVPGFYGRMKPVDDPANPYSLQSFREIEASFRENGESRQENPRRIWEHRAEEWLLTGPIDKPVYFSTKVHKRKRAEKYPELEFLYEKNGFVFYKRKPKPQP